MQYGSWGYGSVEYGGQTVPLVPPVIPAVQRFTLLISAVDRTALMIANTLMIRNQLGQASTCTFTLESVGAAFRPTIGQSIQVYSKQLLVFGGLISQIEETVFSSTNRFVFGVTVSDWSILLDRRVVGGFFSSFSMSSIVSSLITSFLQADGVTYNSTDGDPGTSLGDVLINWITARQAFNQLSNLTGWEYSLDYNRVVRFFPPGTALGAAPFTIADNDGNSLAEQGQASVAGAPGCSSVAIRTLTGLYRNREFVRSSSQTTQLWVDIFSKTQPGPYPSNKQPPGGGRIAFITLFVLTVTPIILVNGGVQRVIPLASVATAAPGSWDWYWIPGGSGVFQNQANAPLGVNDVLEIDYQSKLSPVTTVQCSTEIATRAAAEGTTGVYDAVDDAPNVAEPTDLSQYALAILNRYGCTNGPQKQIVLSTLRDGLLAGQLLTVNLSRPLIPNAGYLITQVSGREVDKDHFKWDVTCELGNYFGQGSAQFFAGLVNRGQIPQALDRVYYPFRIADQGGGLTGGIQFGTQVVQHQKEIVQYISVMLDTGHPATQNGVVLQLLINANGSLFVTFNAGDAGEKRAYQPAGQTPIEVVQGDTFRVQHSGNNDTGMTFVTFTVVTTVVTG